jgi:predicted nucleic acid-binding protein
MRNFFFNPENSFFSPNYVISELFEKKEKIMKYTNLNEPELYELIYRLFEKITFVKEEIISQENKMKAYKLCRDIDEADTPIIALALELDAAVWTGDKKLQNGLKKKGFSKFSKIPG